MNRRFTIALATAAALLATACESGTTGPGRSPLEGLVQSSVSDSGGTAPPPSPNPGPLTPGRFHGTVLGSAPFAPGADTLAVMPRLANVRVTAYQQLSGGASPTPGPAVAALTTGSSGAFDFPSLPGGAYIVTFVPPDGSPYYGIWVTATAHSSSGAFPWWVVLGRR
jgi:hypothetical protein